jgi:hypothetical protein
VNESNHFLDLQSALAEMQHLREENVPFARARHPDSGDAVDYRDSCRLRGYNLIGYTVQDGSNGTSFFQQVEKLSPKEL